MTLWWAEGHEERITYNRKARRADGTTYLMREQDRVLLGDDFSGGKPSIHEKMLRPITAEIDWDRQREVWAQVMSEQ